jgi:ATP synthase protein I
MIVAPIVYLTVGGASAVSLTYGMGCALLPQAFFALRMERAAALGASRAARLSMAAEAGKFLLSAAAFALVFAVLKPTHPGWVFAGFGVMWVVQITSAASLARRPQS